MREFEGRDEAKKTIYSCAEVGFLTRHDLVQIYIRASERAISMRIYFVYVEI